MSDTWKSLRQKKDKKQIQYSMVTYNSLGNLLHPLTPLSDHGKISYIIKQINAESKE